MIGPSPRRPRTRCRLPAAGLGACLALAAAGCGPAASSDAASVDPGNDEATAGGDSGTGGPPLLFVGTDAGTLETDVYAYADGVLRNLTGDAAVRSELVEGASLVPSSAPVPVPSPDADRIALVITEYDASAGEGRTYPATLSLSGGGLDRGAAEPGLAAAYFDLYGRFLVLQIQDAGTFSSTLRFVDADLAAPSWGLDLDAPDALFQGHDPATGDVLVVATAPGDARRSVFAVDPADGAAARLGGDETRWISAPTLSPDGRWMAAEAADDSGRRDVLLWDLGQGEPVRISTGSPLVDAHAPTWEPEPSGPQRLAWIEEGFGDETLPSAVRVLTDPAGEDPAADWRGSDLAVIGETLAAIRWSPRGGTLLVVSQVSDPGTGETTTSLTLLGDRPLGEDDDGDGADDDTLASDDDTIGGEDSEAPPADAEEVDAGALPFNPTLPHWSRDGDRILLWDRAATTAGASGHPVREVLVDSLDVVDVEIPFKGDISYPVYAVENTLLYP